MAHYPSSGCTARTTLHLVGPQSWTAVPAALVYDPTDPFAVRVRFGDGGVDDVDRSPYDGPDDDVRLWPARGGLDVVFLQLRAPSGEALFELSGAVVAEFLRETEMLVPLG